MMADTDEHDQQIMMFQASINAAVADTNSDAVLQAAVAQGGNSS